MNDVTRGEAKAWRDLGRARFAAAESRASLAEFGPSGAVNGAIDAATAEQRIVGDIDDGVEAELRDVALDDFDAVRHVALNARPGSI